MTTGYEPLNTLKPIGPDIWIADGPHISFYGLPFPTRMTIVRLADGGLWIHSPIKPDDKLIAQINKIGPVRHLIGPNWFHYASLHDWKTRYPAALVWVAPGVEARAAKHSVPLTVDEDLIDTAPDAWVGQLDQMIVRGSKIHHEAVFYHSHSKTLILTDLIENFERRTLPWWMRILTKFARIQHPDGQMPIDMRQTFNGHRDQLRKAVEQMITWGPEQVILAHGHWYQRDGVAELKRAFRFLF